MVCREMLYGVPRGAIRCAERCYTVRQEMLYGVPKNAIGCAERCYTVPRETLYGASRDVIRYAARCYTVPELYGELRNNNIIFLIIKKCSETTSCTCFLLTF